MINKGFLIVISGPSGSGKGTIVKELLMDSQFVFSISVTSRKPRYDEEEGVHYFFRTEEQFEQLIQEEELLEWADFVGNYYGTPKKYVLDKLNEGKNVILDIEVNGAMQVKAAFPECIMVFVVPPTLTELRRRLDGRKTEDPEIITRRMEKAKVELSLINNYDYLVVNDSIFKAVTDIINIVKVGPLEVSRNAKFIEQIRGEI